MRDHRAVEKVSVTIMHVYTHTAGGGREHKVQYSTVQYSGLK